MSGQVNQYFEEGKYIYLLFIILLLGNILFNFLAIKPKWDEAGKRQKVYLSLRDEEALLRKDFHNKIKVANSIRQASLDLREFVDSLPPESITSKIRSELYRIAGKSGITMSSVKYSLPDYKNDKFVKYDISFPVSGSYRKTRRFIYMLENMPYLMSINDLALASSKEGGVSVNIKISIYLKAGEE